MDPTTLTLPRMPPKPCDPLQRLTRDELKARVVVLEVANFMAERRALLLAEELRAARAHARLLARRLVEAT